LIADFDFERAASLGEILSVEVFGQPFDATGASPSVMIAFAQGQPLAVEAQNMGAQVELICTVWDGVMTHRVSEFTSTTEEVPVVPHADRVEAVNFFDKPEVRFEEVVVDESPDVDVPDERDTNPRVARYRDLYGPDAVLPSDLQ